MQRFAFIFCQYAYEPLCSGSMSSAMHLAIIHIHKSFPVNIFQSVRNGSATELVPMTYALQ
jgi:adenosine/AMP kinase